MKWTAHLFPVLFMMFILLAGCATSGGNGGLQSLDIIALNDQTQKQSALLGAGDILSIRAYHNPRLNDDPTIRPDGNISLQLIGEVKAAGLSPSQLATSIKNEYAKFFKTSSGAYVIGVGDQLSVKFYFNSELNEELIVRPDGNVSLQLVGDVAVAGLSPSQVQSRLKEAYSTLLELPEIAVIVRDFKIPEVTVTVKDFISRKVYIGGEVTRPGTASIAGSLRAFDAIIQAGGALPTAELDTVVLVRYNGASKPDVYSLNLNRVQSGETPDVLLKPNDILYIPKTTIAQVGLFVDQYLNRLIPHSVSFPFPYNLNSEVQLNR